MALRGPCLPSVGSVLAVLQAAEDVQTRRVGWFDTGRHGFYLTLGCHHSSSMSKRKVFIAFRCEGGNPPPPSPVTLRQYLYYVQLQPGHWQSSSQHLHVPVTEALQVRKHVNGLRQRRNCREGRSRSARGAEHTLASFPANGLLHSENEGATRTSVICPGRSKESVEVEALPVKTRTQRNFYLTSPFCRPHASASESQH